MSLHDVTFNIIYIEEVNKTYITYIFYHIILKQKASVHIINTHIVLNSILKDKRYVSFNYILYVNIAIFD